jgi:hypothetical protein
MSPDSKVLRQEARGALIEAMLSYEGDPTHVAIYALTRCRNWNELQAELARIDSAPSDPKRVSTIVDAVETHLESELRSYLGVGPNK